MQDTGRIVDAERLIRIAGGQHLCRLQTAGRSELRPRLPEVLFDGAVRNLEPGCDLLGGQTLVGETQAI